MTTVNISNNTVLLKKIMLQSFHLIPETSSDRNEAKRYKRVLSKYEDFLASHSDELIEAFTDSVRDFLSPNDMKEIKKKLDAIFLNEMGEDLRNTVKPVENSLSPSQKNALIKSKISDLRKEILRIREEILSVNWGSSIEEVEKYTILTQVLYLSETLINWALDDIEWASTDALMEGNMLLGMAFFLILRLLDMTAGKVTTESLTYSISAVQVALNITESY